MARAQEPPHAAARTCLLRARDELEELLAGWHEQPVADSAEARLGGMTTADTAVLSAAAHGSPYARVPGESELLCLAGSQGRALHGPVASRIAL